MNSIIINNNKEYTVTEFFYDTFYDRNTEATKILRLTFGEVNENNGCWDEYYNVPITSIVLKEDTQNIYTINNISGYFDTANISLDNGKLFSRATIHVAGSTQAAVAEE